MDKFDQIRQGWVLTDKMVEETMQQSFSAAYEFGHGNTFHLGGQGGLAPSAGGGGGGAIGKNARAGKGGDGGSVRVDDSGYTVPTPSTHFEDIKLSEWDPDTSSVTPGAGGGGAGAIGDDAIGGDGGNGGNQVIGTYDIEAMRRDGFSGQIEIVIGKGGRPLLPNQLPKAGEDTILRFMKKDGSLLKEVRAEGGLSATPSLAAYLDGWSEPQRDHLRATRFRVTSLMMASALEMHAGNFYVLGADWRFFDPPCIPVDTIFNVIVSCRFDSLLKDVPTVIFLSLFDPAGRETSRAPLIFDPAQCIHGMAHFAVPLGTTLELAGEWQVRVWTRSQILSYIEFKVRDRSIPEASN
ncbi:hypothetical protein [Rhodopseudomonas palustris]|uniref:hypothetical protein n=1 Tax=Rhodopseudomonas palustris TaxID=1076 RepID=UPI0012EEADCF